MNITINVQRAERALLGRLAHRRHKSRGYVARSLILRGLLAESPADAALLI